MLLSLEMHKHQSKKRRYRIQIHKAGTQGYSDQLLVQWNTETWKKASLT